jgi:hypothetical protein
VPEVGQSVRGRILAIVVAVVVVAVSGYLLDLHGPKPAAVGPIQGTETGAWFCPHGGTGGGRGWVAITNPGATDATIRLTSFGKNGVRAIASFVASAGQQVYREVPATEAGASTEVEYFGGWVGVAAIVQGGKSKPGLAGERCTPRPRRSWFLPDQPTGRDESGLAVVMNPFSTPAQFDVIVRTERRTISPQDLTPFVLPPRTSTAIDLDRYALETPGQTTVTTEIVERLGRVVAGSFATTPGGLRAEVGEPSLEQRWVVPGTDQADSGGVVVMNPGSGRADVTLIRQGASLQEVLSGEDGLSVAPGYVLTFKAERLNGAGLQVESTNRGRIATVAVLTGPGQDTATMGGSPSAFSTWLVMPTLPAKGGKGILILQNPGRTAVDLSIQVIGANGALDLPGTGARTVPAGRTLLVPLQTLTGIPVSAIVRTKVGTIVAAGASYVDDGVGYAATLGLPMTDSG